jgi:hypothetical protein
MTRSTRQFPPKVSRPDGAPSRVRFSLQCHECATDDFIEGPRVLPDDVVSKKFAQRGWVIGRNRSYDLCPLCVGIAPENKLASVFKVTKGSQPVLTPAEVAAAATDSQRQAVAKTHAAIDRLLGNPREAPMSKCGLDRSKDPLLTMMAHDMGEIRALLERVVEQNDKRDSLLGQQAEQAVAISKVMEKHMQMWQQLIDAQQKQQLLQEQMIRAVANIVPTLVRTSEGTATNVSQSVEKAMNALAAIVATQTKPAPLASEQVPRDTLGEPAGELALMPALAQTVEPVTTAETTTFQRRKASFSVTTYSDHKNPEKHLTMVSIDRPSWEASGFTREDRYLIRHINGRLTITRAAAGNGYKAKKIGQKTVVFQARNLGELNYKRTFIQSAPGQILA